MSEKPNSMPYVCMYADYLEALAPFSDEERGRLLMAAIRYATAGEEPAFTGNERFIWPSLKGKIDRDAAAYQEKCEKSRVNGRKGGRPKKTEGFSEEPKKANKNENKNKNENENKNENKNKNEREKEEKEEKETPAPEAQKALSVSSEHSLLFSPPSKQQVERYCKTKGYRIDPGRFVDYYTANGWRMGSAPMQDWKAALRCWNGKEKTDGKIAVPTGWSGGTEL